jgi:integrase
MIYLTYNMPKISLSLHFIRRVTCPEGKRKVDFFDSRLPGFMLEVRASGGKTYYQRYRDSRGRERQFRIGAANILKLSEARRKGRRILAEALLGEDPHVRRRELRKIPTLKEFVTGQYLPFVRNTKRSWRTDEMVFRIHILPAVGRLALDEVSSTKIADLLRKMRENGYSSGTTNRVIVLIRFAFNLAKKWGVLGGLENPASCFTTEPDVCLQRFLSQEEVQRLLAALDSDENQVAAKAIKLLLLTGARRNEITHARWECVDWRKSTLLVPVSKTGRPRVITLSAAAMELLRSIEPLQRNPFIFPSEVTGRPCPSLHFPWSRIRRRSGLLGLRLHDLRHSFASFLVNNGVSLYVVQGLLGHTQPRMTQRYAHLAQETLVSAAEVVGAVIDAAAISGQSPSPSLISDQI